MHFVDEVKIYVTGGDGGRGCVSFRREKHVPRGGPDGGDGGNGGTVFIRGNHNLTTLLDLRYQQHYTAQRGAHGQGSEKHGKKGADLLINVPVGTVIKDMATEDLLADIIDEEEMFVAAQAGRGGKGNAFFKSSVNRAPRFAQPGEPGESRRLKLELKLLADVGIVGFPNAGKSTLIARISAARPRIADYPFTTLVPNLGVVNAGEYRSFVAADIPGLIEGAHAGRGLGDRFLKHVERTSVLLHLMDLSCPDGRDPLRDFEKINRELALYSPLLSKKPQIAAGNKSDLRMHGERSGEIKSYFKERGIEYHEISGVTGEGVEQLIYSLWDIVEKGKKESSTVNINEDQDLEKHTNPALKRGGEEE